MPRSYLISSPTKSTTTEVAIDSDPAIWTIYKKDGVFEYATGSLFPSASGLTFQELGLTPALSSDEGVGIVLKSPTTGIKVQGADGRSQSPLDKDTSVFLLPTEGEFRQRIFFPTVEGTDSVIRVVVLGCTELTCPPDESDGTRSVTLA